jgi:nitroreductase/NAD-dependent dihydropyrimidine dehydrogenase PreA subunit
MTLITVNKETCTKCGLCSKMCSIIYFKEGSFPRQLPGTDEFCLRCGHCLGVCPTGSLIHQEMPVEQTHPIDKTQEINFKQSAQLIKGRRSIREYLDKDVSKEEIERIIEVARYSPTGHNNQEVQWLVINNRAFIRKLSAIGADWLRYMLKTNPGMADMFKGAVQAVEMGQDIFLRDAPAIVMAFAEKNNAMCATDCAIALGYFDLAAKTAGLGCCWAGFFYMSAGNYPAMMKAIDLPEGMAPYGALMVGYPKYKYHRAPARKPARIIYRG